MRVPSVRVNRAMLTLRAHQCRTIAASFHDAETRERMLKVADDYVRMADPILHEQLARAGVRLANELNATFR